MRPNIWLLLVFLTIALTLYGGAHYYVFARLVQRLVPPGPARFPVAFGFLILALSFPVIHFALRKHGIATVFWLNFVSSVWVGLLLYLFLLTLGVDLLRLLRAAASSLISFDLPWNARTTNLGIVGAALLIAIYGLMDASRIRIKEIDIPIRSLPNHLEGFRIVQLSDIHLGSLVRRPTLDKIVAMSNTLKPDLAVITGDLLDEQAFQFDGLTESLRKLQSRHGTYAVTGNHEFFAGVERAVAMMEKGNITVLRNRWVDIADGLQLIGRDDPAGGRMGGVTPPSLEEILKGTDPSKPTIYLYHTPETKLEDLQARGISLQLSGHTHRGQVWPGYWITKWIYKTNYGLYRKGNATIYVTSGAGTWGPPLRLSAPPEIVLFRLRAADS